MVEDVEEGGGSFVAMRFRTLADDLRHVQGERAVGAEHAEPEQLDAQPICTRLQLRNLSWRKGEGGGLSDAQRLRLGACSTADRRQLRVPGRDAAQ
ncbi:hypothetical protein D3C81_963490 [compost metagenome]